MANTAVRCPEFYCSALALLSCENLLQANFWLICYTLDRWLTTSTVEGFKLAHSQEHPSGETVDPKTGLASLVLLVRGPCNIVVLENVI